MGTAVDQKDIKMVDKNGDIDAGSKNNSNLQSAATKSTSSRLVYVSRTYLLILNQGILPNDQNNHYMVNDCF